MSRNCVPWPKVCWKLPSNRMAELKSAAQLAAEAQSLYQKGQYLSSGQIFQASAFSYEALGDPALAVEMRNNASVAYLQGGDPQSALAALDGVEAFYTLAGDLRSLSLAIGNRASILDDLRQDEAAVEAYERCAELLKQIGDYDTRSYVMQSLSKLQLRRGQQLQAFATMKAGIDAIPNPSLRHKLLKRLLRIPSDFLHLR